MVTVLFADIAGSTQLGERLDPEAVRTLLARHFADARRILERHGGTVEKFIGDAVMAVFGIPRVHEDDALRAVRAALEIQQGVAMLNAETGSIAELGIRIGINTGEVVAGNPSHGETLITGDAVNIAARLEQAAGIGEVLVGPRTHALIRDAVSAGRPRPLQLKGKSAGVEAHPIHDVLGDVGRRRDLDATMVGRTDELRELQQGWIAGRSKPEIHSVTVVGTAGVGKSRLVREFADAVDARVVKGRCLPYGDGITYWPIREALFSFAGVTEADSPNDASNALGRIVAGDPEAPILRRRLEAAIGLSDESAPREEIFWAVRRTLELIAARRATVLIVEDVHWAEPTLLDLLEFLGDRAKADLMLIATARPELIESRPGWGSGTANHHRLELQPLGGGDTDALLLGQAGGTAVPAHLRERILVAAEGNPLYVEEMVAMLREIGALREQDNAWSFNGQADHLDVPPTITALLGARLDHLPTGERTTTSRAYCRRPIIQDPMPSSSCFLRLRRTSALACSHSWSGSSCCRTHLSSPPARPIGFATS